MGKRANNEGTIFQRGNGRWVAEVTLGYEAGRRIRQTVYGATQEEARSKRDEVKRNLASGRPATDSRQRLDGFLHSWLDEVVDPSTLAESTKAAYRYHVEAHIVPVLGHVTLAKLRPLDVQRLLKVQRERNLSERTRQYTHAVLRRALGVAVDWGLVGHNVASAVSAPKPRRDHAKVHPLTLDDARCLLEAASTDRLFALWVVLLLLGLRKGEALALRWRDLDFEAGCLRVERTLSRVKGKGLVVGPAKTESSERTIYMPAVISDLLRRHHLTQAEERAAAETWDETGLVFTTRTGRPIEPSGANRLFATICKRAGIGHERIHNLRHTAATVLRAYGGADLFEVQRILGHSSLAVTTGTYGHVVPATQQALADRLGALYGPILTPVAVNRAVIDVPEAGEEPSDGPSLVA